MFFSWFAKNKKFQRGSGLSGQIAPFLLVVMAILLIAAIATINIGRVSLDKTCSANAADAGSLAAASSWASAFNILTKEWNAVQLEFNYDLNFYLVHENIYPAANDQLNKAIDYTTMASGLATTAFFISLDISGAGVCNTIWSPYIGAAVLDGTATYYALEADMAMQAFIIYASAMRSYTESFHEQQWQAYCEARTFMHERYLDARLEGLTYAFSNSCIPAKLSDSQSDDFSAWMKPVEDVPPIPDPDPDAARKQLNFPPSNGPYKTGIYSWKDKLSQTHTVTAKLDLPSIVSYELQHTQGSYLQIMDKLDKAIDKAGQISQVFATVKNALGLTAALYFSAFTLNVATYIAARCCGPYNPGCCGTWGYLCSLLLSVHASLRLEQGWIVSTLGALVSIAGLLSIPSVKSDTADAADYWVTDGVQSSFSCADVENWMIVKIAGVTLSNNDDWTTLCTATQQHPGSSTGIIATTYPKITSTSRSRFDGCNLASNPIGCGEIGKFKDTYDANIESTS